MKKFTLLFSAALTLILLLGRISFAQTILSADFESGQPAGWTITSNATDGGWKFGTNTQLQSTYFPIAAHTHMAASNDDNCDCDKSVDYLITPVMDFSSYSYVFMSFDYYFFNAFYGAQEVATIEASTDGGATWAVVSTLAGSNPWSTLTVNLSAYAGQSNVQIAFHYNDGGGWLYGWALDNVSVYVPVAGTDISVTTLLIGKVDPAPYFSPFSTYFTGKPLNLYVVVKNEGTVPITSFDLSWSDGVNTYNETVSGINIDVLSSYTFNPSQDYTTLAGSHTITFSVSNVNGGATELSTTNNSGTAAVNGVTANPDKKYLVEEATGTWCGWCTRGIVYMDYMRELYPDQFVGIAVHNTQNLPNDPMTVDPYDAGVTSFPGFAGFPSVITDRSDLIDPSELEANFISHIVEAPAVKVSAQVILDPNTNKLQVTVTGDFLQNLSGDYRFNAIIVEDSAHGTTSGWAQHNYYAGGGNGPMGGFENLNDPVPASAMYFDQVGRVLLGDFDGTAGSLPSTITSGNSYSYIYQYTVPSTINVNHMWVAVMVLNNSTGEVVNVNKSNWVYGTVGISNVPNNASLFMYPNPAKGIAYLDLKLAHANDVTIQISNTIGQVVSSIIYPSLIDDQIIPLNISALSAGVYNVQVKVGEQVLTRKLVVSN